MLIRTDTAYAPYAPSKLSSLVSLPSMAPSCSLDIFYQMQALGA